MNNKWTLISGFKEANNPLANCPDLRLAPGMTGNPSSSPPQIWLYGGADPSGTPLSDLWVFTSSWELISNINRYYFTLFSINFFAISFYCYYETLIFFK